MRIIIIFSFCLFVTCYSENPLFETEVLIIGGGTGGVAAGIQSARLSVSTLIVEPSPWLGGMLTAAGVSATDGNHNLPSGIWGEFRQKIWDYYGGPDSVSTGWVSNTLFEPHVGARIFSEMAAGEEHLDVWYQTKWKTIEKEGDNWKVTIDKEGEQVTVISRILIDGTDLGDVAAAVGVTYDLGMDSQNTTAEEMAPELSNDIVQDLTFAAVLKDYGIAVDKTIPKPEGYDPAVFTCSCREVCEHEDVANCNSMLSYGKLPGNKYMINWPIKGNDYYANVVEFSEEERLVAFDKAKQKTLQFVYFIQQELGFKSFGLADDEFPTFDKLPFIPYHREGRRIHGIVRLNVNYILLPYAQKQALYRTGIAVGDYPIDHHHDEYPNAPEIDFPPVPSFNIPAGCLIPAKVDNFLVADKAISVTNIVNGASRLQPVILQIGQAAGAIAAISLKNNTTPRNINIRELQDSLLAADCFLMPYMDVQPSHAHFPSIQRIGAAGIFRGEGIPYKWANRTFFYPDSLLLYKDLKEGLTSFFPGMEVFEKENEATLKIKESIELIFKIKQKYLTSQQSLDDFYDQIESNWQDEFGLSNFDQNRKISRLEMAVLLDDLLDPFHLKLVTFEGAFQ